MQSAAEPVIAGSPRRRTRWPVRHQTVIALVFIAVLWQILSLFFPRFLVPGFQTLIPSLGKLLQDPNSHVHFLSTVVRVLVGCGVSSTLGLALGIAMGVSRTVEAYGLPVMRFTMGIPALSWVLLVVIWFREPEIRIFVILTVICLPVITMNVLEGVKGVPKDLYEMLLAFRPSRLQAVRLVILPWVMPFFVAGIKVALSIAVRLVVFAELMGATLGIGAAMFTAFTLFDVAGVLVWSVSLVVVLYFFDLITGRVEASIFRWRPEVVQREI